MSAQYQIAPAKTNIRKRKMPQESNTGSQKRQTGINHPNDTRLKDEKKFESPRNVASHLKMLPVGEIMRYSIYLTLNFDVMILCIWSIKRRGNNENIASIRRQRVSYIR